ncbi:AraC family transcriptional regulator ligand-binding domain-containing protein [Xanthobacter dioxanivorans]|uniref:AraC family transcriptional regulator ligand-binding domain-containing protein n=1 Tax=Xanthobacter dioxanivorans TaxID=2528964 RepID=UPI001E331768|nr:AraC family transcriptional regulator ligand-binding domain-containing protein [Xanthobacter dioxanivorans]
MARCPHLGLLVGARNDHRALGPIGEMMASAPTLGDAFRDYVGLQISYSRGAMVYLQNIGDDTLLGYGLYAFPGAGRQINDLVLAIGCNMVRSLTGGRADPLSTPASVGQPINIAPYRSALKTTTLFDQEHTAVEVSARDMALPLPGPIRRDGCNFAPASRRRCGATSRTTGIVGAFQFSMMPPASLFTARRK